MDALNSIRVLNVSRVHRLVNVLFAIGGVDVVAGLEEEDVDEIGRVPRR